MKIGYIFKNITLLNVLLTAVIAFMAHYTILPLLKINIKYALPSRKKTFVEKEIAQTEHALPSPSDYVIISEENLFHPERRIPPEKKDEAALPKPEFVLYGTVITDSASLAYLEDLNAPRNTPGRGQRQTALKKGDTFGGFTLKEVDTDKIVMVRGEEKMTVYVNDPQRPKMRTAVTTASKKPPGQPSPVPQPQPAGKPKGQPFVNPLIKPEQATKSRAPMTPAEERARHFFSK